MNNPFKRQHPSGIWLEFSHLVVKFGKAQLPLIGFFLVKANASDKLWFLLLLLPLLGLPLLASFVLYWFNTYQVDHQLRRIVVKEGFIGRSTKVIQFERVQQIATSQTPIQKWFDTYSLTIESAGGEASDVRFKAVNAETVRELEQVLATYIAQNREKRSIDDSAITEDATNQPVEHLFNVSNRQLIYFGLTAYYLQSLGLLLAYLVSFGQDMVDWYNLDWDNWSIEQWIIEFSLLTLGVIGLFFMGLVLFNVMRMLVLYFALSGELQDDALIIRCGLWNKRQFILRPSRVQQVVVRQNPLQKKAGIYHVLIYQATGSEASDKSNKNGVIQLVGLNENQLNVVLRLVHTPNELPLAVLKPNFRKWVVKALLTWLVLGTIGLYFIAQAQYVQAVLCFVFAVLLAILFFWGVRQERLLCYEKSCSWHTGIWDRSIVRIEIHRLQRVQLTQYAWQRKLNIAHLCFTTAATVVRMGYLPGEHLKPHLARWKQRLSIENRNWM